jgi:hypothetical protein
MCFDFLISSVVVVIEKDKLLVQIVFASCMLGFVDRLVRLADNLVVVGADRASADPWPGAVGFFRSFGGDTE